MSAPAKKAATPKKAVPPKTKAAPKGKGMPTIPQIDLAAVLKSLAGMEASIGRVLDVLTKPALPYSAPALPTAVENAAERLEALLALFSGKQAQNILQDMLETGRPPTREQLLRQADKLIAAR